MKNDEDVLKELLDESSVFSGMFQEQKQDENEKIHPPKERKEEKETYTSITLVLDSSRHMAVRQVEFCLRDVADHRRKNSREFENYVTN